jgi:DNA-binding transcriptional LysR family regulator
MTALAATDEPGLRLRSCNSARGIHDGAIMRFTLKHLEYFVAAAEAGSIKLASEHINISQPSISSAISHLEKELQIRLFVRHHAQGLALTRAGKMMMREARLLLRQAEGLYALSSELQNDVSGRLAVGCMVTLAPMIIPELGHSFTNAHKNVSLALSEGSHEQLLRQLREIEIDAAICYDLGFPADVTFEALASLPPHVLISGNHRLARRKSLALGDLASEPLILLDLPFSNDYFYSLFQSQGLTPSVYSRSGSQEVVRTMVANGYGYTIANVRPRNLTALDGRKLKLIGLEGDHKPMSIGLATLVQDRKPKVLSAFEQHCRETITQSNVPGMAPIGSAG